MQGAAQLSHTDRAREHVLAIESAELLASDKQRATDAGMTRLNSPTWDGNRTGNRPLAPLDVTSQARWLNAAAQLSLIGVPSLTDSAQRDAASALGGSEKPAIRAETDDEPPPGSFDAMPLLVLLALEQIAAAKWRPADKHGPAVLAWQPRRRSPKTAVGA
jgi:hypothetical protein